LVYTIGIWTESGNPQPIGRHERMLLTLKSEAAQPDSFNFLRPQERLDRFVAAYNEERPARWGP